MVGRAGADVRPVPGDGRPVPRRGRCRRPSTRRCASTGCRRSCSCCAGSSACLSGVYGIGYLRRNDARGLVTPRMRREFYGLIPAYVFAMLLVVGLEQSRDPVDRRRADDAGVGLPRGVPQPRHLARSRVEVPDAGEPRARLRAARHRALFASGQGALGRACRRCTGRASWQVAPRAASVHAAARRRVRPDRLRHEGGSGADAHVEAGCVPRSAVAGGAC